MKPNPMFAPNIAALPNPRTQASCLKMMERFNIWSTLPKYSRYALALSLLAAGARSASAQNTWNFTGGDLDDWSQSIAWTQVGGSGGTPPPGPDDTAILNNSSNRLRVSENITVGTLIFDPTTIGSHNAEIISGPTGGTTAVLTVGALEVTSGTAAIRNSTAILSVDAGTIDISPNSLLELGNADAGSFSGIGFSVSGLTTIEGNGELFTWNYGYSAAFNGGITFTGAGSFALNDGQYAGTTSLIDVAYLSSANAGSTIAAAANLQTYYATSGTMVITGNTNATYAGQIIDRLSTTGTGDILSLVMNGSGTQVLSGVNTYSGPTIVNDGVLEVTSTSALASGTGGVAGTPGNSGTWGSVTVNNGGTLAVAAGGAGEWASGDINNLITTANFATGSALGIDTTGGNFSDAGVLSGSFGLAKLGGNTLTLSGDNTYSGATSVNAGALVVSGSLAGPGAVTVNAGAALGGAGKIFGNVTIATGGMLYPGIGDSSSPTTLTLGGSLSLSDSAGITLNLLSGGIDNIAVAGTLGLSANLDDELTVDLLASPALDTAYDFLIASNGSGGGNFESAAILTGPDAGGLVGTVGYNSTNNAYEVTFTTVPEPGAWSAIISGFGLLVYCQKRRSKR